VVENVATGANGTKPSFNPNDPASERTVANVKDALNAKGVDSVTQALLGQKGAGALTAKLKDLAAGKEVVITKGDSADLRKAKVLV